MSPEAPQQNAEPESKLVKPDVTAGIPHRRFTSVSLSDMPEVKPPTPIENREVEKLTQERLAELWRRLVDNCKDDEALHSLLADKEVELKNNNLFFIYVPNLYLDSQLSKHQRRILDFLRGETGNEALNYKAVVRVEHVERKAYLPRDKFDEMAAKNPSMYTLRQMFTDIDF